jgi:hypothetical protein
VNLHAAEEALHDAILVEGGGSREENCVAVPATGEAPADALCTAAPGSAEQEAAAPTSCLLNAFVGTEEGCSMKPGTSGEEDAAPTICVLTAVNATADPPVNGSCAVATGSGTCGYVAPASGACATIGSGSCKYTPAVAATTCTLADGVCTVASGGGGCTHVARFTASDAGRAARAAAAVRLPPPPNRRGACALDREAHPIDDDANLLPKCH